MRNTLAIRKNIVTILPETLKYIDFDPESFKEYTLTNEKKLFLQYDNKNRENRVLVFMSQFGIDLLRESLRDHSDGKFDSSLFGALALMPLNKIPDCLTVTKDRMPNLSKLNKNAENFVRYF